jgi:hypothetical protein
MAFRKMFLAPWWNKIKELTLLVHLKVEENEITDRNCHSALLATK